MKIKNKKRSSIFLKIILIFFAAHSAIAITGFTVHHYFKVPKHNDSLIKSMEYFSQNLVRDIAQQSDAEKAKQISDSLQLKMRINTANWNWISDNKMPDFKLDESKGFQRTTEFVHGITFMEIFNEYGHFLFEFDTEISRDADALKWRILIPVFTMMFILTVLYLIIRQMLKPIRELDKAALKLGEGQLDLNIKTKRKDELGDLVNSFNEMATRIKDMLKARDQLLLDASHELRSPLTRVKVALEFMEDSSTKTNIREDILEMETMISELLESARLDSPYGGIKASNVNMTELIQQIVKENKEQEPGLFFHKPEKEIYLDVDAERIKTAILNLVQNGIKYSTPQSKPLEISILDDLESIKIVIQDFGRGIPEEDLHFIFEPFYRVDKSRQKESGGYGLGLSLTKKIIDAHHAQILAESAIDKGSTFTIKFKKEK